MAKANDKKNVDDSSTEEKLRALFELQIIDSKIDKIHTVRGELPLEVKDLEDTIAGLQTRMDKIHEEGKYFEDEINNKKNVIKEAGLLIKKYQASQNKVRNNREFDSLNKEIEFQNLEMQLAEKRIKEYKAQILAKKEITEKAEQDLEDKKTALKLKKKELDEIISETEKEEQDLVKKSASAQKHIEERLLNAYKRIRSNARNGLAVVPVERDACGGCFNKIPPQRQMDIKLHKKIIVCEHCGRVLVDPAIAPVEKLAKA